MRWKVRDRRNPKLGDTKIKKRFLLLPLMLEGERRWMEFSKILYIYTSYYRSDGMGAVEEFYWKPIQWLPIDPVRDCDIYRNGGCVHVDGFLCDIEDCNGLPKTYNKYCDNNLKHKFL